MNWVPALCSLIREPHPCIQPLRNVWAQWSAFQPKPGDHRQLTNQGLSSAKQPRNHTSNPATCSKEKDFPVSFYYSSTVFPISCCNKFLWTQQFEMAQIWQLFRILLWVSAWHGVSWTVLLAGSSRGRHISLPFGSFRGHLHSIICVAFLHLQHTSSVTAVCVCVCVCVCTQLISHIWLFGTPWTVGHQAPLSMRFPRQECWGGLPFSPPGDLPSPGIEPVPPALQADSPLVPHCSRISLWPHPEQILST